MREVCFYSDQARVLKRLAVGAPPFIALGIAQAFRTGDHVFWALLAAGFIGLAAWAIVNRAHVLTLDEEGVHPAGMPSIPWTAIADVRPSLLYEEPRGLISSFFRGSLPSTFNRAAGDRVLELTLHDRRSFMQELSLWRRTMTGLVSKQQGTEGVRLDLSTLSDSDFETVERLLKSSVMQGAEGAEPALAGRR